MKQALQILSRAKGVAERANEPALARWLNEMMKDVRTADEEVKRRLLVSRSQKLRRLERENQLLRFQVNDLPELELDAAEAVLATFAPWQRLHQTGWHVEVPIDEDQVTETLERLRRRAPSSLHRKAATVIERYRTALQYFDPPDDLDDRTVPSSTLDDTV